MNRLKKCGIIVVCLIVLIIDYIFASKEYVNFLKTYGNRFSWFGVIASIGPYCLFGIVTIVATLVLVCKKK